MKTVITSAHRHSINIAEIIRYRELIYFLVGKEIKLRYRQTIFGILWAVAQPSVASILFTFVFASLLNKTDIPSYLGFIYLGMLFWTYFSQAFSLSVNSYIANQALVTKMYIPRYLLPFAMSLVPLLDFAIGFIAYIMLLFIFNPAGINAHLLFIPLLLAFAVIFTSCLGMVLALINTKYRDVRYALPFMIQLLFFVTPVLYAVPQNQYSLLWYLNPLCAIITFSRMTLLGVYDIHVAGVTLSASVIIATAVFAFVFFKNFQSKIADYL